MIFLSVLQLIVLGVVAFLCYKIVVLLSSVIPLLRILDKPTKEEKMAQMTTIEAQKEMIRTQAVLETQMRMASKLIAYEMAQVLQKIFGKK